MAHPAPPPLAGSGSWNAPGARYTMGRFRIRSRAEVSAPAGNRPVYPFMVPGCATELGRRADVPRAADRAPAAAAPPAGGGTALATRAAIRAIMSPSARRTSRTDVRSSSGRTLLLARGSLPVAKGAAAGPGGASWRFTTGRLAAVSASPLAPRIMAALELCQCDAESSAPGANWKVACALRLEEPALAPDGAASGLALD